VRDSADTGPGGGDERHWVWAVSKPQDSQAFDKHRWVLYRCFWDGEGVRLAPLFSLSPGPGHPTDRCQSRQGAGTSIMQTCHWSLPPSRSCDQV
jgi:hypothetical protein